MSAAELRAAVRAVLDQLDDGMKDSVIDTLMTRGTKTKSGWKPARPSPRIVEEAMSFAEAARHIGRADPDDVTEHLRRATKAFLAGDHASARAVFEAILPPIASVDIDLGQHELVEEVLGVDARACVAQYVASVYTTTPLRDRADVIVRAIEQVQGVGTLSSPIRDMEDASPGALPDLGVFLPLWVKRLQRFRPPKDEWETEHERWLREAVFRVDGVDGLERIARKTRRPRACLAWCEALADQGNWTAALKACDAAARLVRQSHWRGELLDGAALAAQELGRPDLSKRLEVAWRAAPTLTRLLRWLVSDGHELKPIRTKATRALALCPKTAARQIGLLRVLVGDVTGAATALSKSPGLGWSDPDHPGHTVFPLLAMLLSNGTIGDALATELDATGRDPLESFGMTEKDHKPRLTTPSIVTAIQGARPGIALTDPDRVAAIDAMRITAEKRVEGLLGNSRRRHYGHAALLVASCVAFAPKSRAAEFLKWAMDLRQQYWRRHAFREELARACESLGVSVPA
ncbi:MAG: hypothetical protein M3541_19990 [Acidobacteriota bacterium]|nr:hypothetical protein [Acidobacteriota bacterium]